MGRVSVKVDVMFFVSDTCVRQGVSQIVRWPNGDTGVTLQERRSVQKPLRLKQQELEKYASEVMMLDEKGETFVQKLNRLFTEAGESYGQQQHGVACWYLG